jgi:hypothetical protein
MKKNIFFLVFIISFNSFSQNPIPYTNIKMNVWDRGVYIYVDSLNLSRLSKEEYSYAEPFDVRNGLAIVHQHKIRNNSNDHYYEAQLINKSFEVVFSITCNNYLDLDKILHKVYDNDGSFIYEYCVLQHYEDKNNYVKDRYGLLGIDGKKLTEAKYSSISEFSEGVAIISNSAYEHGFIEKTGIETLNPTFLNYPKPIMNGKSLLQTDLDYVYIDKYGKDLGHVSNPSFYTFSNGLYKITNDENYSIFKNKIGKTILTLPYKIIGNFNNNNVVFFVKKDQNGIEKAGLINILGKIIIPPIFNAISKDIWRGYETKSLPFQFKEGLAAVKTDNGWGFVNTKGQLVIQDKYSDVTAFSEGLAMVKDLYGWSVINNKGEVVINYTQIKKLNNLYNPTFINFKNGFITVIVNSDITYYIDKAGRELIQK